MTTRPGADNFRSCSHSPGLYALVLVLFFISGLFALVYQVLWMKQLGLLFGNTAAAAATTLCAFFAGLAAGGRYWGLASARMKNPLRIYGLLEIAVAISAVGYFFILDAYRALYPMLFDTLDGGVHALTALKFLLSLVLLFPAAFFMGGTLPVLTQAVSASPAGFGFRVSTLYAVNTFGAAAGTLLAGFVLPPRFGYTLSCVIAVAGTSLTGILALVAALGTRAVPAAPDARATAAIYSAEPVPADGIRTLALLSGFCTIALQVLWTRMFAQVLQNSVYTYSLIVFVFLVCLAAGSVLAARLMKSAADPRQILFWTLFASALSVAVTPFVFNTLTDGLHYLGSDNGWNGYLLTISFDAFRVLGVPVLLTGILFPYLLKLAEPGTRVPGRTVGHLLALNTFGSIAGAIAGGFMILGTLGLWPGIRLIAMIYLLAAMVLAFNPAQHGRLKPAVCISAILLLVTLLDPGQLPRVRTSPIDEQESLLQVWESGSATVAVVRRRDNLKIRVNNTYTLGGSASAGREKFEAHLPLMLHPEPRSVFFLGLGTGISAGAVLDFPVRSLIVAELFADVVRASKDYFGAYNNHLFFDPRARVLTADGRNLLSAGRRPYDLIISDLFVPWRSGAGSLYSLEHYRSVKHRLNPGGLFMQWLPAYQITQQEFGSIIRTLLQVFPQVTLWRGDFAARTPVLGVLASAGNEALQPDLPDLSARTQGAAELKAPLLSWYLGNPGQMRSVFARFPLNSDDRPLIEYRAPVSQRKQKARQRHWLTGETLIQLLQTLHDTLPPDQDPYLRNLSAAERKLPAAGLALHKGRILRQMGKLTAAETEFRRYRELSGRSKKPGPDG